MIDDLTDGWPDELARVSPQKASTDLRPRVLSAVSEALSAAANTTATPKDDARTSWERYHQLLRDLAATTASFKL